MLAHMEGALGKALDHFKDCLNACIPTLAPSNSSLGRYEADVTAMCLARLALRYAFAVHELAIQDVDNYAPAAACARSGFETGAIAAWLMVPDNPFEREGRWIGYFKSHERFHRKLAEDFSKFAPESAALMIQAAEQHTAWRSGIERQLPAGVKVVIKPSMPEILNELGCL